MDKLDTLCQSQEGTKDASEALLLACKCHGDKKGIFKSLKPAALSAPGERADTGTASSGSLRPDALSRQGPYAAEYSRVRLKPLEPDTNVLFVFDVSGSMGGILGQAAKTIDNTVDELPSDVNVGLRIYSEVLSLTPPCSSSETLVEIGPEHSNAVHKALSPQSLSKLDLGGPRDALCYALRQSWKQNFGSTSGPNRLILITDGGNDCGGDPCALVEKLNKQGPFVSIDVIGFGAEARDLKCLSDETRGTYTEASTITEMDRVFGTLTRDTTRARVNSSQDKVKEEHARAGIFAPRPITETKVDESGTSYTRTKLHGEVLLPKSPK